jgi:catechol 2,3-dioxygenase-like lactoylglutathione lyase family enzyme
LAWYVTGVDRLADRLRDSNARFAEDPDPRVAYASFTTGKSATRAVPRHGPIPLPPGYRHQYPEHWESGVVYTHFRDTHGMLEFCEPSSYHAMPPRTPDDDMTVRGKDDPLGIEKSSHHTIVVRDARTARDFWVEGLGAVALREGHNATLGARSAWVRAGAGDGTILELAEPVSVGPAMADLEACGLPILHSVTFKVSSLDRVRDHLAGLCFQVESDDGSTLVTDPASSAGARFGFTTIDVRRP